jgi:hypothetical protein
MIAIVDQHLRAEGAVAVYTDDIVHDAGGRPGSPRTGKDEARAFYRFLSHLSDRVRRAAAPLLRRRHHGPRADHDRFGRRRIPRLPGNGRRVSFGIFHVFGFRDGLISREQVRIDRGPIVAQLSAA